MDLEEYKNKLKLLSNDFEIISQYDNKKILFKHICGYTFPADFSSLKNSIIKYNGGCPKCAMEKRNKNLNHTISVEDFNEYLKDKHLDNEYTVISTYFNKTVHRTYAEMIHNKCKRSFTKRINDFKNGYLCPYCGLEKKDSFLTIKIKDFLNKNLIDYNIEYSLVEIERKGTSYLRSDFKIGNIFLESDGEQHFKQKVNRDPLEIIRERDLEKDRYFFNNSDNYTLVRIPYTEIKNIDEILKNIFINKSLNALRKTRCMVISKECIINYENKEYYEINKTKSCRSKTV